MKAFTSVLAVPYEGKKLGRSDGNGNSKWKVERLPLRERTKQMKSEKRKLQSL